MLRSRPPAHFGRRYFRKGFSLTATNILVRELWEDSRRERLGVLVYGVSTGEVTLVQRYLLPVTDESRVDVAGATSMDETMEALRTGKFDVCLLDLDLGEAELYRLLRTLQATGPKVPVVLLGSPGQEELMAQGVLAGARDFLFKGSLTPELLLRAFNYSLSLERYVSALRSSVEDQRRLIEQHKADLETAYDEGRKSTNGPRAVEVLSREVAGVVHDFNNLLTSILGYTDLLLPALPADSPSHDHLLEVRRAGERAKVLAERLMLAGREAEKPPASIDPHNVIDGVMGVLRGMLGEQVELVGELGATPEVLMRQVDLERIVTNLVVNAGEASRPGGQIIVATQEIRVSESRSVNRADLAPGRYALVAVYDFGIGMDKDTVDRIFEPFYTTKEVGGGHGLGLATVRDLVKRAQGHVSVTSSAGEGTTVRIWLPAVAE